MPVEVPNRPIDAVRSANLPAVSLVASPTKRRQILDLAIEAENRGFPAVACPTLGSALGLCASLAHVTNTVHFYTAIQGIYGNSAGEIGSLASHIHEVSSGRFALGLGVSHEPMVRRLGASMGPPLSDMSNFVESLHANEKYGGQLPPIYVAALRNRMLDLATSIAEGALWANASCSYTTTQVTRVETAQRESGFYLANMIPTVISEDRKAAAAVNRKTMSTYVRLPNYRNYWKAAGYVEEMEAIESAIAAGNTNDHSHLMSDRWLEDCTIFGSPNEVRDGFLRWRALGIEPIAVMSSTTGGQVKAIGELFDVYSK
jgi:alkanesulfonate monooxygenase SsuD/methylene tetrahydromethanopterin reductase-like flavin-dependent oxidoreductase (luciferase family)